MSGVRSLLPLLRPDVSLRVFRPLLRPAVLLPRPAVLLLRPADLPVEASCFPTPRVRPHLLISGVLLHLLDCCSKSVVRGFIFNPTLLPAGALPWIPLCSSASAVVLLKSLLFRARPSTLSIISRSHLKRSLLDCVHEGIAELPWVDLPNPRKETQIKGLSFSLLPLERTSPSLI